MLLRVTGGKIMGVRALASGRTRWPQLISPSVRTALEKYGLPTDGSSIGPDERTGPSGMLLKGDVIAKAEGRAPPAVNAALEAGPERPAGASTGASSRPGESAARPRTVTPERSLPPATAGGAKRPEIVVASRDAERGSFANVALSARAARTAGDAVRSKRDVPQASLSVRCDVTAAVAAAREASSEGGVDFGAIGARVASLAVRAVPAANGWCAADGSVTPCARVDAEVGRALSGAAAADGGVAYALIAGADAMSVDQISRAVDDAVAAEEAGAPGPSGGADPTVSVVDLGSAGVNGFAPFVRPPAVCAFGIGALESAVVPARDGSARPEVRKFVTVSISHDARALDDAEAAKVASAFQRIIEGGVF